MALPRTRMRLCDPVFRFRFCLGGVMLLLLLCGLLWFLDLLLDVVISSSHTIYMKNE